MAAKLHRNLLLGTVLILAASTVLLLSDMGQRTRTSSGPGKRWKIFLIQYNNVVDVQESEDGVLEGLRNSGLTEGRDYEARVVNAQGDMATVSALVDAAVNDHADLLVTFSTPTLQAAIRRAPSSTPIVFTYVASAVAAGAGRSEKDHLPNVTGVSTGAAYDDLIAAIKRWFPHVRTLGTLFVPAESNMVFHTTNLEAAARRAGYKLEVVPVSTATEIADAATALTARDVDAICQVPGNLTAAGFGSISRAAQRAHIPVFAFQQAQAKDGALLVAARDYRDAGREAARLAVAIVRGDTPAKTPFQNFNRTKFVVNLDAARALDLSLPPDLVQSAQELIEDGVIRSSSR
ncbi:MAG TPA: ABC transporter substrate-binding protein [Terriglobales bacterium]|nr:ABC transporter substrate-binding protein [Terriglobales bacterium]